MPWRIADRKGKSKHGYAWQFRVARPDSHGLYFCYLKGSRGGDIPRAQLKDYRGAIQTDGYKVYDYFEKQDGVTLLGCMAHIRRKFVEAERACPGVASKAIEYIELLYTQEENLRERKAPYEEVAKTRQGEGLPNHGCHGGLDESRQHDHYTFRPVGESPGLCLQALAQDEKLCP